jgi:hypothetical protein
MPAVAPAPPGAQGARPAYWFPLALFGVIVALPVPLYVIQLSTSPAFSGWVAYAPLSRTVSWSSAQAGYSSSFSVLLQSDTGLAGIAEGWYWAAALTAGFVVTAVWYHRAGRTGPGWPYLVIALALWGLARHARSRPLAIAALAYTVAVLVADWPDLRSAPSALIARGGDPLRMLVETGPQTQRWVLALLPAVVLLVAALLSALPFRLRGQLRAG